MGSASINGKDEEVLMGSESDNAPSALCDVVSVVVCWVPPMETQDNADEAVHSMIGRGGRRDELRLADM